MAVFNWSDSIGLTNEDRILLISDDLNNSSIEAIYHAIEYELHTDVDPNDFGQVVSLPGRTFYLNNIDTPGCSFLKANPNQGKKFVTLRN